VTINAPHTATAHYTPIAPPPSVSISPLSATIYVGQSVPFTSTVTGGTPPYSYQWYMNDNPVSGATSSSWMFTPTTTGVYYVYLKVTDANGIIAQSETARIVVTTVPVGGYTISLAKQTVTSQMAVYTMLIALFGVGMSLIKRKRK
jgi:PKD repeat protein